MSQNYSTVIKSPSQNINEQYENQGIEQDYPGIPVAITKTRTKDIAQNESHQSGF
jgi:hypothetical protein